MSASAQQPQGGAGSKRKRPESTNSSSGTKHKTAGFGNCTNVSERYLKIGRIGQGTYGVVYQARDKVSGNLVALKRCLPHHESTDGFPVTTLREIQMLRRCSKHPNIVTLHDVTVSSSRSGVFLVFEYCPHDLAQLVDTHYARHNRSPFSEPDVKRLIYQLLSALSFLHEHYILHRDIKLSNLLYNNSGELKLADFGLSRSMAKTLTPKVVSLWYRPPELLLGSEEYGFAVDLWGAGCTLGELLDGVPLLNGKNEVEQVSKIFHLLHLPTVEQWPNLLDMPLLRDGTVSIPSSLPVTKNTLLLDRFSRLSGPGLTLLSKLLSYNPDKRGTATEALQSLYFTTQPTPTHPRLMPRFPSKHLTKD